MILATDTNVDITVLGLNGRDSGTPTAGLLYHIYLIKNPTTGVVGGLITDFPPPTLPSGFTKKRYLGQRRYDLSSNFYKIEVVGKRNDKLFKHLDTSVTNALTAGGATAYATVALSQYIAAGVTEAILRLDINPPTYLRPLGSTLPYMYFFDPGDRENVVLQMTTNSSGQIQYYKSGTGTVTIDVFGYMEYL